MKRAEIVAVYQGSNGEATKALYAKLEAVGPAGVIAMNLFRACKASERAKAYRGRSHKGAAYDKKNWSMDNLCKALTADDQTIVWGWAVDDKAKAEGSPHHWVLYVEIPDGQVSFHSDHRGDGPDYAGKWDGVRNAGPGRICQFCADILAGPPLVPAGEPDDISNGDHTF